MAETDVAETFERLVRRAVPRRRGLDAWEALLRAHATLVRQLELEIAEGAGITLGDFDVLAQLARAGGQLRMTELAERALTSRSGLTRRIDKLVDAGMVRRTGTEGDGRGVAVKLTRTGQARLEDAVPIHLHGVLNHFGGRLDDRELAALERALNKVTVDCRFG